MSEVPGEASAEGDSGAAGGSVGGGIPSALLVSAIAVLVVVVSMPRFRAHVLDANREDAKVTIGLLGAAVFRASLPSGPPLSASGTLTPDRLGTQDFPRENLSQGEETEAGFERAEDGGGLYEFIQGIKRLRHRFPDARATDTPGELLHHGYRFATGYVLRGLDRHHALVAWPDAYGKSGDIAFATVSDGSIYGHPNRGLWSGPDPATVVDLNGLDPSAGGDLLDTGSSQGLMNVDLSDESWVLIHAAAD